MGGAEVKALAIIGEEDSMVRPTQPYRLFEHCVEHRHEIAGRRIDDLQHLGGRSLLFQRLTRPGDEPRAFSIAITACAAKFCNSAISFARKGPASLRAALIMPNSRLSRRKGTNTTLRIPCAMAASALGFGASAW